MSTQSFFHSLAGDIVGGACAGWVGQSVSGWNRIFLFFFWTPTCDMIWPSTTQFCKSGPQPTSKVPIIRVRKSTALGCLKCLTCPIPHHELASNLFDRPCKYSPSNSARIPFAGVQKHPLSPVEFLKIFGHTHNMLLFFGRGFHPAEMKQRLDCGSVLRTSYETSFQTCLTACAAYSHSNITHLFVRAQSFKKSITHPFNDWESLLDVFLVFNYFLIFFCFLWFLLFDGHFWLFQVPMSALGALKCQMWSRKRRRKFGVLWQRWLWWWGLGCLLGFLRNMFFKFLLAFSKSLLYQQLAKPWKNRLYVTTMIFQVFWNGCIENPLLETKDFSISNHLYR